MEIVMATDDNYAKVMITSINSICRCNKDIDKIIFHIIDDGISEENRRKLDRMCKKYSNININYLEFKKYSYQIAELVKETDPPLPLITFARLFIADMINTDKILYIDCDTICNGSLKALWDMDLKGNIIAAVQDTVNDEIKKKIDLSYKDKYINAGVLLIDLKLWREKNYTQKAVEYIKKKNGYVMHNDQGVLNALLKEKVVIIHPKYNAMTPLFMISRKKIMKYFSLNSFYSKEEMKEAIRNPVLLHFVRFTTSRPWEKRCHHPLKKLYLDNYMDSMGKYPVLDEYPLSRGQKILFWVLNNLPYTCYLILIKLLKII